MKTITIFEAIERFDLVSKAKEAEYTQAKTTASRYAHVSFVHEDNTYFFEFRASDHCHPLGGATTKWIEVSEFSCGNVVDWAQLPEYQDVNAYIMSK